MSDIDDYRHFGGQGGLEAANRVSREMATWDANPLPLDALLRFDKDTIDDRARDVTLNDGYAAGVVAIHKDNIVGNQFRLNSQPDADVLGVDDDAWLQEFQLQVEARFNNTADSTRHWLDASGMNDFTSLIRQAIGMFLVHGEVLAVAEWIDNAKRPYATAVQMISPKRLSNPYNLADDEHFQNGVERDVYGRALAYHIREAHPFDFRQPEKNYRWKRVEAETAWGRQQVIHIIEQLLPDQTRGISEMVSVLKQMRMTRRFQDVELQQAVLQATYAASIESDLPPQLIAEIMGANPNAPSFGEAAKSMLSSILHHRATNNLQLDGARIPVLHPNTKLNLQQLGQPSGVGSSYEQSLLRHVAAGLGVSYEQFSRDYTQTNYSSARASMNETFKFMQSRKKMVADRFATAIYRLWLEEQINLGNIPLPKGKGKMWIYKNPEIFDALAKCSWIGAARGQIDEMKETQASILKVKFGLATMEMEAAKYGLDWREVLKQRKREQDFVKELGIELTDGAEKEVVSKKPTKSSQKQDNEAENLNETEKDAENE
nr:MAG TPA: portal protein [Caudoviricetes sp.]